MAVNDPFAGIAQQSTPAASDDPFAAIAQPSSGAAPASTPAAGKPPSANPNDNFGSWAEHNFNGTPEEQAQGWGSPTLTGFVKSAGSLVGTLLDLSSRPTQPPGYVEAYKLSHPNATDQDARQAYEEHYAQTVGGRISKHLQDAAHWLRQGSAPEGFMEHVGAIGEQVLEYIGTDGLLKLVGGGAAAAEAAGQASRATGAAEQLKNAQQVAATLGKNPRIAGLVAIGLKASKDAAGVAAQTYLHTEDPHQAAQAALLGAGTRVAGESLGAAGRYLLKKSPTSVRIADEEIPALASQINEHGEPTDTGAAGAPQIAAAQQQAAGKVMQNLAQRATAGTLERINKTRPIFAAIEDPGRMLPAPEESEPFTFSLEGPGTTEGTTGEMAQAAGKVPGRAAFKDPQYTTSSRPTPRDGNEGTMGADFETAPQPQAKEDMATGGGALQTTDPREAEGWLQQLENLQHSPMHEELSEAQQSAIEQQRQNLEQQLGLYHASPYAQRFEQIDVPGTISQVRTFGDAAAQIRGAAKPIFQTLDQASDGEFAKWRNIANKSSEIMRRATSNEAYDAAEARFDEANGKIMDLIDRHRSEVNMADYTSAKSAWRDSVKLSKLHTVMERMSNGITAEESETGLTRIMTGRTKQLETFLASGNNRAEMERLIGADGVRNLKQLTQLLAKANTARSTTDVLKNIANQMHAHMTIGGTGGLIGGTVAHAFGVPWYQGALTGAALTEGMRAVLRDAAVNPRIGNMVHFAATNGVSPQQYAPLIARAIAEPLQEQPEGEQQEQQQQEQPAAAAQ